MKRSTEKREERPAATAGKALAAPKEGHEIVAALLKERLSSGKVLDIPCGGGPFSRCLVDTGFEPTYADVQEGRAFPRGTFQRADMNEPLPFEGDTFDAVVSIEGIEHIERPFDFIRECGRVLRPGGYLFLATPNISALRSRWRWFLTGFHGKCKYPLDELNPGSRHHITMLSFPELRYLLHTNGFCIEHIAANRIKAASWLYLPLVPLHYVVSRLAYARGIRNEAHGRITADVLRQMMTRPVLLGESVILVACKQPEESLPAGV